MHSRKQFEIIRRHQTRNFSPAGPLACTSRPFISLSSCRSVSVAKSRGFPKLPYSRDSNGYARSHSRNIWKGRSSRGCTDARAHRARRTLNISVRALFRGQERGERKQKWVIARTYYRGKPFVGARTARSKGKQREKKEGETRRGRSATALLVNEKRQSEETSHETKTKRREKERGKGRGQRKIEREEREVVYAARSKVVFETRGGNKIAGSEDAARLALVLSELFYSPRLFLPFSFSFHVLASFVFSLPLFLFLHAATTPEKSVAKRGEREERRIAWFSRCLLTVRRTRLKGTQAWSIWIWKCLPAVQYKY